MKGRAIKYDAVELQWLEAQKTLPISQYHAQFIERFEREDVSASNLHALRKRKGWRTGRTGFFSKGSVPHNKGKPFPVAANHPNCKKTQFKKGNKPHNTNYLGHERVSKDGYIEISIDETNPHTGYERRYVLKHRWLWEQVNGPVPDGYALKCLDGNKQNVSADNWEAIPRALLPSLNGGKGKRLAFDKADPELKPAIMAVAKIKHKIRGKTA